MGTGRGPNFGNTRGRQRVIAADVNYSGDKSTLNKFLSKRKDVDPDGFFDVIAHGTQHSIEIHHNDKSIPADARLVAQIIKHNKEYKGKAKVRLLSCDTGGDVDGFAQKLANKLHVTVVAPTKKLWVYDNGNYLVAGETSSGKPNMNDKGRFKTFKPRRMKR